MVLCAKTKQMATNTSFINEVLSIQQTNKSHRVQIVPLYFYRISYEGITRQTMGTATEVIRHI